MIISLWLLFSVAESRFWYV